MNYAVESLSQRTGDLASAAAPTPADTGRRPLANFRSLIGCGAEGGDTGTGARSVDSGMVSEENSGPYSSVGTDVTHETNASAPVLPPVSIKPSAKAIEIKSQRLQILNAVAATIEQQGCTVSAACELIGVDQATYSRWRDAFEAKGEDGLLPGYQNCGRKSNWEKWVTPENEQWMMLWLQNRNCGMGDPSSACRLMAADPECPTGLSIYLKNVQRIPRSFLRKAYVNPQIRSKSKGPRNYQLNSIFNMRTLTEIRNGTEVQIVPGDWWELDDMSINQPFWFEVPDSVNTDRACTVDGIGLGRQGLYCMDAASGKWLGKMLVGRSRDAYRAEDILRFLRELMKELGKPRRGLVLERGIWMSTAIVGYNVSQYGQWDGEKFTRPAMDEDEWEVLVAGVKMLGIEVVNCWSPMQKGFIEGGFNQLQKYLSAIPTADIGRHRGEGEAATKSLIAAKQGRGHPAAKGFWHIDQAAAGVTWSMGWLNSKRKHGRLQAGVPDNEWLAAVTRWPLQDLTPDDEAVFLPEKRELQVTGGHVLPKVNNQPLPFINPELFADLGNGYRLLIAFDPSHPERGAVIWNRETGIANRHGWKVGQFLGWAAYEPPCPRLGQRPEDQSIENRKRYFNFHRTVFTAIKSTGETTVQSSVTDGNGNSAVIEKRGTVPKQIPAPARATAPETTVRPTPSLPIPTRQATPTSPRSSISIDDEDFLALGGD